MTRAHPSDAPQAVWWSGPEHLLSTLTNSSAQYPWLRYDIRNNTHICPNRFLLQRRLARSTGLAESTDSGTACWVVIPTRANQCAMRVTPVMAVSFASRMFGGARCSRTTSLQAASARSLPARSSTLMMPASTASGVVRLDFAHRKVFAHAPGINLAPDDRPQNPPTLVCWPPWPNAHAGWRPAQQNFCPWHIGQAHVRCAGTWRARRALLSRWLLRFGMAWKVILVFSQFPADVDFEGRVWWIPPRIVHSCVRAFTCNSCLHPWWTVLFLFFLGLLSRTVLTSLWPCITVSKKKKPAYPARAPGMDEDKDEDDKPLVRPASRKEPPKEKT